MPYKSRWSVPIETASLPSFLFGSSHSKLPEVLSYVDADRPETHYFTFHDYREWSKRVAAGLISAGLIAGDRVLLYSGNNLFFPTVFMGVIMADGIFTTANPTFTTRELAYQLKDSGTRFLLAAEGSLAVALEASRIAGLSQDSVYIFDDAPFDKRGEDKEGIRHWSHLISNPESGNQFTWKPCTTLEEAKRTVCLLYSSGTTGVPKGVELSHYNLIANCCQVDHLIDLDPRFSRDSVEQQRWLCFLPWYHGLALIYFGTVAPRRKIPVFCMKRFDLHKMLCHVQQFKISELLLVPPIVVAMAKSPTIRNGAYDLSSVRKILAGAAPMGREICEELESLWPNGQVNVKQGWAMSEAPCQLLNWDTRETSKSSSVGELMANCEAKIMDDDGINELPDGTAGELWVRAPNVMNGYWRNVPATQNTITTDGWLKTGDIAYIDAHGKFFIVDRKKELIKVKGNQVAPAELESVLLDHSEIADAAVVGVKVEEDERPRAYIVKKKGASVTREEILKFMENRVAKIKRITGGIVFTDEIPKNPSGKILRRLLRERATAEQAPMAGIMTKL
ncbi:putative 4-coumarate-CoA ligase [Talaromyces proteolyticus]|uniref:4-coumarate-CoA ligase n=1 Tax=Talaromyces proteolyticus TaxID=1131652 RepID=A0AAD4KVR0_9EURO|nr:putative 4-coumarate-CoA ligase [Talaromyces proteolyticus]KAH8700870.1 putative 4-coumarate-CoA ligase [Talaromyces proteolyticus]